jgi:hypothetical protein
MRRLWGLRCWLKLCPLDHYATEHGCGGRCVDCGKIFGYLTSEELRAIGDRAIAKREGSHEHTARHEL